ncbi:hypothetical protein QFZ52_000625 [Arthrobacter woluwensis]|uniref:hypothetical protein n=1 Tax=Arthrobacter woluwensis TaxID=156980 RepID=UPI00277DFEB5|nr:hypothetical protein [Arthrobacter woluwensis]MDQ0707973.1 hypothetical protein [Arthrobacter woluwensis]
MTVSSSSNDFDEQFSRALDLSIETMSENLTPSVKAFLSGIRERNNALRSRGEKGVTAEYLVVDLIGLLSDFESRLRKLENSQVDGE